MINRESQNRGYARLWCSVILQAVSDIETGRRDRFRFWKSLQKSGLKLTFDQWLPTNKIDFTAGALEWIVSDEDRPGSFVWICDQVDLDRHKLRDLALSPEGRKALLKSSLRPDREIDNDIKEAESETEND